MLGKAAFFDNELQRVMTYLGSEWRNNALVRSDVPVEKVLRGAVGFTEERMNALVELLNIKIDGHMHELSDGQRQGVQIAGALMKPFEVLLMDETTVECDVLVRKHLLAHLKSLTEKGATIMYATHVFDGMAEWPTHLMHVAGGRITVHKLDEIEEYNTLCDNWNPRQGSPLSALVEMWLERDWAQRIIDEKEAKERGETAKPELTVEQRLANTRDTRVGDKFYNYWG